MWKDEELYEVHNNEVSFQVDYLLTYVVVGVSLHNNKPTKKRLQCAVFGGEGRVGMNYTAYLYVFDDCEASLEVLNLLEYWVVKQIKLYVQVDAFSLAHLAHKTYS